MKNCVQYLNRLSLVLNKVLVVIAGTVLVLMVALACANVALRSFGYPIKGTFELIGFFGAIVASFALGITQINKQHIAVDVVINLFPQSIKRILAGIGSLVAIVFFVLAAWQTMRWGTTLWRVNELSETLRIVYFPFVYAVSLGCSVIVLVLLIDMVRLISAEQGVDS
jgi:TRAP-type C4-dicarboxylate transport system permease small subunit